MWHGYVLAIADCALFLLWIRMFAFTSASDAPDARSAGVVRAGDFLSAPAASVLRLPPRAAAAVSFAAVAAFRIVVSIRTGFAEPLAAVPFVILPPQWDASVRSFAGMARPAAFICVSTALSLMKIWTAWFAAFCLGAEIRPRAPGYGMCELAARPFSRLSGISKLPAIAVLYLLAARAVPAVCGRIVPIPEIEELVRNMAEAWTFLPGLSDAASALSGAGPASVRAVAFCSLALALFADALAFAGRVALIAAILRGLSLVFGSGRFAAFSGDLLGVMQGRLARPPQPRSFPWGAVLLWFVLSAVAAVFANIAVFAAVFAKAVAA